MAYRIIRNDITKVKADAIVNTASRVIGIGTGVDYAIYNAAGKNKLLKARAKLGIMTPGDVFATKAFDLDAKMIIHVCGNKWRGGKHGESFVLNKCYEKALYLAEQRGCKSIAFPLLGTGNFRFPIKLSLDIALDAFTKFLEEHEMDIILVLFDKDAVDITKNMKKEVLSFIADEDVRKAISKEYNPLLITPRMGIEQDDFRHTCTPEAPSDWQERHVTKPANDFSDVTTLLDVNSPEIRENNNLNNGDFGTITLGKLNQSSEGTLPLSSLDWYIKAAAQKPPKPHAAEAKMSDNKSITYPDTPYKPNNIGQPTHTIPNEHDTGSIGLTSGGETGELPCDIINEQCNKDEINKIKAQAEELKKQTLSRYLQNLIIRKSYSNAFVYSRANISRAYFSKLMSGNLHPAKDKVIAIAIAMKLNMSEAEELLRVAGYAFSPVSESDYIIQYFILKQNYNTFLVDDVLFELKLPTIFSA